MGVIARVTKTGGGTNFTGTSDASATELNSDLNTMVTEINGLLDDANVETATIPGAKSLRFTEISEAPSTPASNDLLVYSKDSGGTTKLYLKDSAGSETELGGSGVSVENRDVVVAEVVNTVTETAVYSYSVPGNTLSTNKMLRLTLLGDYLNDSGASRNVTVRVKYGATTLATMAHLTLTVSANRRAWLLRLDLSARSATNDQAAYCASYLAGAGSGAGTGVSTGVHDFYAQRLATEDSTGALTLQVTVQHSAAHASLSMKAHVAHLEEV